MSREQEIRERIKQTVGNRFMPEYRYSEDCRFLLAGLEWEREARHSIETATQELLREIVRSRPPFSEGYVALIPFDLYNRVKAVAGGETG